MNTLSVASNPFERYKGIGKPDEKKEQKTVRTAFPQLEALLKKYQEVLAHDGRFLPSVDDLHDAPTPEQIDQCLQSTAPFECHKNYEEHTGIFLSKLIQNSYEAGHNNFRLTTRTLTKNITYLDDFKGGYYRPIHITIDGNIGHMCGHDSSHARIELMGNAKDWCGDNAEDSTFIIHGTTGFYCAGNSKHCRFHLLGDIPFDIGADKSEVFGIKGTEFIVYRQEKYEELIERLTRRFVEGYLPLTNRGIKAILAEEGTNRIIEERMI